MDRWGFSGICLTHCPVSCPCSPPGSMHTPPSPALGDTFYKQVSLPPLLWGITWLPRFPGRPGAGALGLMGTHWAAVSTCACFPAFCLFSLGGTIQKGPCHLEAEGKALCAPAWLGQLGNLGEKTVPGFGVVCSAHRWADDHPQTLPCVGVCLGGETPRSARG